LLLSLVLIGVLIQRLYGGHSPMGPSGGSAITEPVRRAEDAVKQVNQLEQERVKNSMGGLQPATNP
jgi:hypothetical protein